MFKREPLAAGLTSVSWVGWNGGFGGSPANEMAKAFAPRLAVLAAAQGSATSTREPTPLELIGLVHAYLRLRDAVSVPGMMDEMARDIARSVIRTPLAPILPDRAAAKNAAVMFDLARSLRAQWAVQFSSIEDLVRAWWVAKRVNERTDTQRATESVLGMSLPVFVRACQGLLTLAYASAPQGRVALTGALEQRLVDQYELSDDVLRLAAFKLSRTPDEFTEWHHTDVDALPNGLKQYAPNPLSVTPLIRIDEVVDPSAALSTHFLCPSVHHLTVGANALIRASVAGVRSIWESNVGGVYGEVLEDYVELVLRTHAPQGNVYRVDGWENEQQRKADFFTFQDSCGLIIESKRSLGTEFDKHVLDAGGIVEILSKLNDAYFQCETTQRRRPWRREPRCRGVTSTAAIILVDELCAAEGGALSYLMQRSRAPDPPFEVMGVSEFENAIAVLGVKGLVSLIQEKWRTGNADLPLRLFASKVKRMTSTEVQNAKSYLQEVDQELLIEIGLANQSYAARWP